jgi:hypothetical protein
MDVSFTIDDSSFGASGIDMSFIRQNLNQEELNELCEEIAIKKIQKELKHMINGVKYKEKKVKEDGDCFFHVVRLNLKKYYDIHETIKDIRFKVGSYMLENSDRFRLFYDDDISGSDDENESRTYHGFINDIIRTNEWADQLVIQAFQELYGIPIKIYELNKNDLFISRDGGDSDIVTMNSMKRPIYMLYVKENHYNALIENNSLNNKIVRKDVINNPINVVIDEPINVVIDEPINAIIDDPIDDPVDDPIDEDIDIQVELPKTDTVPLFTTSNCLTKEELQHKSLTEIKALLTSNGITCAKSKDKKSTLIRKYIKGILENKKDIKKIHLETMKIEELKTILNEKAIVYNCKRKREFIEIILDNYEGIYEVSSI